MMHTLKQNTTILCIPVGTAMSHPRWCIYLFLALTAIMSCLRIQYLRVAIGLVLCHILYLFDICVTSHKGKVKKMRVDGCKSISTTSKAKQNTSSVNCGNFNAQKCGLWISSIGATWEFGRPLTHWIPDLLNQNQHFTENPRWFVCTWKFEKQHVQQYYHLCLWTTRLLFSV